MAGPRHCNWVKWIRKRQIIYDIAYIKILNDTNDLLNNVSTLFSLAKPFILGTSDSSDIDNIINSDNIYKTRGLMLDT